MLHCAEIKKTLFFLNRRFISSSNAKRARNYELSLYSKTALLELSGWIEESFDGFVIDYLNRTCKEESYRNKCIKFSVKPIYGFNYSDDISKLLITTIGPTNFKIVEDNLKKKKQFDIFHGTLSSLTNVRNRAAHTFLQKATPSYEAPSVILKYYSQILPAMKIIDKTIRYMH